MSVNTLFQKEILAKVKQNLVPTGQNTNLLPVYHCTKLQLQKTPMNEKAVFIHTRLILRHNVYCVIEKKLKIYRGIKQIKRYIAFLSSRRQAPL